ncbi:MAG: AccI family restriction endonuclease [Anaerolineae bacterium]|nr:AccI family restriction endonuclease [Anaerolineae bacterium]
MSSQISLFDRTLQVSAEWLEFPLCGLRWIDWDNFLLNPRRLRGSDFLMRWSQGVWSEERLVTAVNDTGRFFALPYGPSGVAPSDDINAYELYFERLEKAGLLDVKRPDLLIFSITRREHVLEAVRALGGLSELPFIPEDHLAMLLDDALLAVECENSLWKARQMPDYRAELKPQRRLNGKLGLKKNAVLPTIIVKEEDRERLRSWQAKNAIPVHVWQVFYDLAWGISFDRVEALVEEGLIEPTRQIYQAPSGATSQKIIYKAYYHYAC